jgi:TetR/AcrR family transcriptional regulator
MARAPRKNNGMPTREAIMDAAEALFVEKGFSDTSMSGIANKAQVTKSLIHHHFGSKDNLWFEVKKRRFKQYSKVQFNLFSKPDPRVSDVKSSIVSYFEFLKDNPEFVRLMLWSIVEHESQARGLEDKLSMVGVEQLRQAQKSGEIRKDVDAKSIMIMIFCLVLNWFQAKDEYMKWLGLDPESAIDNETYLHDLMTVFFDGARSESKKDEQGQSKGIPE